jgi:hypothetical protein
VEFKIHYLAKRNPSVAPEDWPRTWRSHPKYVQNFPVIGSAIERLNYCARIREPMLDGARFDPPGVSQEYDGVAVVESPDEGVHRIGISPEDYELVKDDERRVFSTIVENFNMHGRESLAVGETTGRAAVITFVARKPGVSPEAFLEPWRRPLDAAARRALERGRVIRYVRNEITLKPPPGYEFDGVSEAWFASADDAVRAVADSALAPLAAETAAVCDERRSVTMLTEVIFSLPRL